MANAKRCDICGDFYPVPEFEHGYLPDNYLRQLNFDSCKKCQQDIRDYILSRQAEREPVTGG